MILQHVAKQNVYFQSNEKPIKNIYKYIGETCYVYSTLHVSAHTGHHQVLFKYKDIKRRKMNFVMSYPIAGRGRAFGITTRYGWTARGSNPGGGRDFPRPCRPVLGSTESPVKWVLGLSVGKTADVLLVPLPTPI